ncbi:hypothetical protein ACEWY4_021853 [Coilia grayii]|uniref:Uncharacterized protein n=1 Tax=Coilia grayii TaxID=363190 RepID=A0ABD1J6V9_9TELE
MATNDSDTSQGQQKVGLKRKLTGPPRLLLGKAKATNQTGERSDARALRHQRRMDTNGTSKDSAPPTTHHDTLGEEGTPPAVAVPPESPPASGNKEVEDSHQTRLENDSPACDVGCEDERAKDQRLDDGSRKTKKKTKEGLGLRKLLPHVFMCVRWRQKKHANLEAKTENVVTAQTMECTGEDTQSTGDTITLGGTCHSAGDANTGQGTRAGAGKRRTKTFWFPSVGRHKSKGRHLSKQSQSLAKDSEMRKTTLRKRIQGFLARRKKTVFSKQFECADTQTPLPEHVEGQADSHLDDSEDLSKIHKEYSPDREGEAGCPETVTVSAEVTANSEKGSECESKDAETAEPSCKMSEDLNLKEDENKLQSCVDIHQSSRFDLKEAPGLSDRLANSTCVAELSPGFSPQIDIALAMDDVFENGQGEIQLFEDTSETAGPDHDSHVVPRHNASNMSFLTVPADSFWSQREANSPDVKPCFNTFDCSLAPEDTSLLGGESLLILTANSLVRAAIKSALCQLSREVQPPLTNSHRDTECANMKDV